MSALVSWPWLSSSLRSGRFSEPPVSANDEKETQLNHPVPPSQGLGRRWTPPFELPLTPPFPIGHRHPHMTRDRASPRGVRNRMAAGARRNAERVRPRIVRSVTPASPAPSGAGALRARCDRRRGSPEHFARRQSRQRDPVRACLRVRGRTGPEAATSRRAISKCDPRFTGSTRGFPRALCRCRRPSGRPREPRDL